MKITQLEFNNRKKTFDLSAGKRNFSFPYAKARPAPDSDNAVVRAFADPELGGEAFTYVLQDGSAGTVHLDHVLEYNQDPQFMWDLFMHKLTVEVKKRIEESGFSKRELTRKLRTSPAQLYRLLDENCSAKSPFPLFMILHTLNCDIGLTIRKGRERKTVEWAAT